MVAANPPELAVNLWEHNWLVATSCPNRLWSHSSNNWDDLIAVLEDIVALVNANGAIYALGAMGKRHIGPTEYAGWVAMGFTAKKVSKADLDKLPDWDDKVAATRFKPTGHPGAALKTWISSYNTHRHSIKGSGNNNHVQVRAAAAKLRADATKADTALRSDLSDHEGDSGQHGSGSYTDAKAVKAVKDKL